MAQALTSETFLTRVDKLMAASGGSNDSVVARRQQLLSLLIPEQQKVYAEFGFFGEPAGYVHGQQALMEHAGDPELSQIVNDATQTLFKRAKLM